VRLAGLAWLAVVAAAAVYLLLRLHHGVEFQTDLLALLPQEERDVAVQRAKDKVTALLGQRIVVLVGDADRAAGRCRR
jgi:predicted exporter